MLAAMRRASSSVTVGKRLAGGIAHDIAAGHLLGIIVGAAPSQ
jgi:hypothetical protein